QHGADVAHVDLDVRERRRAEREHDRVRLRGVGGQRGQVEIHLGEQLVDSGLLERHPLVGDRGKPLGVLVDAQNRQAGVREADREREPDAAQSDDGDVVTHAAQRLARGRRWARVMPMGVPLFDNATALAPLRESFDAAIRGVLDDSRYILGPNVAAFEQEFAASLGARHAIGVGNGPEALRIALRAMGVGPGDEVAVPSFTFYASAEAIPPTGAKPVFCDVDPDTMMVTPETVKSALTPRTKAVIVVHLFGNVAP